MRCKSETDFGADDTNTFKFEEIAEKKILEAITKFRYYLTHLYPQIFQGKELGVGQQILSRKGPRSLNYMYLNSKMQFQALLSPKAVFSAVKQIYVDKQTQKINENTYMKLHSIQQGFFSRKLAVTETIQFHFSAIGKEVQIYVVHRSSSWENFIEKYTCREQKQQLTILSTLICVIRGEDGFFPISKQSDAVKEFIATRRYLQSSTGFLHRLEGILMILSHEGKKDNANKDDPAYSVDHMRERKMPAEHFKLYQSLKKTTVEEIHKTHKDFLKANVDSKDESLFEREYKLYESECRPQKIQSMVCRFFIAYGYHQENTLAAIREYRRWFSETSLKYTMKDFEVFVKLKMFTFLGEDKQGRPVVLNRPCNIDVSTVDMELYCKFYLYYLEIYVSSQLRGYVDQLITIVDTHNVSTSNFSYASTKKYFSDFLRYMPERQMKTIVVRPGSFGAFIWKMLSPLLPKRSLEKVLICSNEPEEALTALLELIPAQVIPEYLGGKNIVD